ncbi:hypothetical protein [Barnesiella viscericola]|nr:hypothetical protein [Barnesiella viscericola]
MDKPAPVGTCRVRAFRTGRNISIVSGNPSMEAQLSACLSDKPWNGTL